MRYTIFSTFFLGATANLDYKLAQPTPPTSISPQCAQMANKLSPAPTIEPEFAAEIAAGAKSCSFNPPASLSKHWNSYTKAADEWVRKNSKILGELKYHCPMLVMESPCPAAGLSSSRNSEKSSTTTKTDSITSDSAINWRVGYASKSAPRRPPLEGPGATMGVSKADATIVVVAVAAEGDDEVMSSVAKGIPTTGTAEYGVHGGRLPMTVGETSKDASEGNILSSISSMMEGLAAVVEESKHHHDASGHRAITLSSAAIAGTSGAGVTGMAIAVVFGAGIAALALW